MLKRKKRGKQEIDASSDDFSCFSDDSSYEEEEEEEKKEKNFEELKPHQKYHLARLKIKSLQSVGLSQKNVHKELHKQGFNTHISTVKQYWNVSESSLLSPRQKKPQKTAATPSVTRQILYHTLSRTKSVRKIAMELQNDGHKISKSTVSRVFLKAKLPALKRPTTFAANKRQIINRFKFCQKWQHRSPEFWALSVLTTDEKMWALQPHPNRQNNRIRATKRSKIKFRDVKEQYPKKQMCWGGVSGEGATQLIWYAPNTSVNKNTYRDKVLQVVLPTLTQNRHKRARSALKRRIFANNDDWYFEHDHASAHLAKICTKWLDDADCVPKMFEIASSRRDHYMYAPAKLTDIWWIERVWRNMTNKVYAAPTPKTLKQLRNRVNTEWKKLTPKYLTKLAHEVPARMKTIINQRGKQLSNGFEVKKSRYHCECSVCCQ